MRDGPPETTDGSLDRSTGAPSRDADPADEVPLGILMVSAVSDLRGGAEKSLVELARSLRDRGHTLALAVWREGELASTFSSIGEVYTFGSATDPASPLGGVTTRVPALSRVVRLSNWIRLWLRPTAREVGWLVRCIREARADVIHTNCDLSPLAARGAARRTGVPWAAHVRDHWRHWFHPRTARCLRSADTVLAPSSFLAHRIRAAGIDATVVSNPVGGEELRRERDARERARIRTELGVGPSEDTFAVAVVGRLDEQKGSLSVVAVARRLMKGSEKAHSRVRFFLAGTGTEVFERRLRRAIRAADVTDHVHVLGHRDDVPRWLPVMDALAVPSVEEPFGRMIVEGMHAGLPVVAFESGAAREIVEDGRTGLLVPAGDVAALASALEDLVGDPARARRLGLAARSAALRYEPSAIAREMESVYEHLLRG